MSANLCRATSFFSPRICLRCMRTIQCQSLICTTLYTRLLLRYLHGLRRGAGSIGCVVTWGDGVRAPNWQASPTYGGGKGKGDESFVSTAPDTDVLVPKCNANKRGAEPYCSVRHRMVNTLCPSTCMRFDFTLYSVEVVPLLTMNRTVGKF